MVRVSVGIEHISDIQADFEQVRFAPPATLNLDWLHYVTSRSSPRMTHAPTVRPRACRCKSAAALQAIDKATRR